MKKTPSNAAERRRQDQHQTALESIRRVARVAVTPDVAAMLVWTSPGAGLDDMVDRLARMHKVEAHRRLPIQRRAVEAAIAKFLKDVATMTPTEAHDEMADIVDRNYSRFLLASDVGFELGFAAATSLVSGGRS